MIDLDYSVNADNADYDDLAMRGMSAGESIEGSTGVVRVKIAQDTNRALTEAVKSGITLLGIIVKEKDAFSGVPSGWSLVSFQRVILENETYQKQLWKVEEK